MSKQTGRPAGASPPSSTDRSLEKAKETVERVSSKAKAKVSDVVDSVQGKAQALASDAKSETKRGAEEAKDSASSSMKDFAAAIRTASDELSDRDQSAASNIIREAARGLESVSQSLQGASIAEVTRSVTQFARQQPVAFLGAAALVGIGLGRFIRATGESAAEEAGRRPRDNRSSSSQSSSADNYQRELAAGAPLFPIPAGTDNTGGRK